MARKGRRKHAVKAELRVPGLSKAGSSLNLKIFARKSKLGEITIGRGSLYWRGTSRQKRKRISWTRFADMMDDLAYKRSSRSPS